MQVLTMHNAYYNTKNIEFIILFFAMLKQKSVLFKNCRKYISCNYIVIDVPIIEKI